MFEIGWTELVLIGIVALIVIGPKDLPDMFRTMGRFTAKLRSMTRDFQRAMDQAAKDSGVNDIAADLKAATSAKAMGLDAVKDAATRFEKWDPMKPAAPSAAAAPVTVPTPVLHGTSAPSLAGAEAARNAVASSAAQAAEVAKPVIAKTTSSLRAAPKPAAPKPDAPKPVALETAAPKRASPKPAAPKPVAADPAPTGLEPLPKPAAKPRAPRKPAKDA